MSEKEVVGIHLQPKVLLTLIGKLWMVSVIVSPSLNTPSRMIQTYLVSVGTGSF